MTMNCLGSLDGWVWLLHINIDRRDRPIGMSARVGPTALQYRQ